MSEIIPCTGNWLFSKNGSGWQTVSLPHHAYLEPDEIACPQIGVCTYRYEFFAPEEWKRRVVYFMIGAAMQKAEVSLNGIYHFTHFGGYQKFFIPLMDDLVCGEKNVLEIRLSNAPDRSMPPGKTMETMDFCYHSGLYRDAALIVYNPVHITDPLAVSIPAGGGAFIRTESLETDGSAVLSATCHVVNEFPPTMRFEMYNYLSDPNLVSVRARVKDPDGVCVAEVESEKVEIRPNCDHTFRFGRIVVPDAKLWSPDTPVRYTVEFTVTHDGTVTDTHCEKYGIRRIAFTRDGFYLNGKKIFLNGTNRHMEYPFVGNALSPNAHKRDAVLIKRGGFNFVRLSHYNQDPAFLDACDELGLFTMPPIPGWQAYHANSAFIENAYRDCRELIRSLRNRPGVILWEVSLNEAYPPSWLNAEFVRIAHEEYPGDQCYAAGDTYGLFEGWDVMFPYDGNRVKDKPLLMREYGDWAFGGGNSTSRRRRSDPVADRLVQAWNFLWSFNELQSTPGMIGCANWCFADYNRGCDPYIERSGAVDIYRLPKITYEFYRSQSDGEDVLSAVHDEKSKLIVFSNADEIELARTGSAPVRRRPDNGPDTPYGADGSPGWQTALPEGFDRSGGNSFHGGCVSHLKHPPFTFMNVAPLKDGEVIMLTGFRNGKKVSELVLRKPGDIARVTTRIRTEGVAPAQNDLVFADAVLEDANGTVVPVSRAVKPVLTGEAKIVGGMAHTEAGIASWLIRVHGEFKMEAVLED